MRTHGVRNQPCADELANEDSQVRRDSLRQSSRRSESAVSEASSTVNIDYQGVQWWRWHCRERGCGVRGEAGGRGGY